jgi:hypothetical protein
MHAAVAKRAKDANMLLSHARQLEVQAKMAGATGGSWQEYAAEHSCARSHAMEQSALYKRHVTDAVAPLPPLPAPGADAADGADGASGSAPPPAAEEQPYDADAVAAEVAALFEAAKGLSLSVLMASRLQQARGQNKHRRGGGSDGSDEDMMYGEGGSGSES